MSLINYITKVPILGTFPSVFFKKWGYLPRMHLVAARVGYGQGAIVAERWTYRGDDQHKAYDTRQVFTADWPHGVFCELPPVVEVRPMSIVQRIVKAFQPRKKPAPKPKLPMVAQLQKLPPDKRIQFMRLSGMCD
ncbi:hypothetical protein [Rhodoferax sp.]|jgi:hypothetical protein|uniref:hypothetical protein n=1 Tax=Rhodoferax sp. TaxID=50421 RepID=UPI0037831F4D